MAALDWTRVHKIRDYRCLNPVIDQGATVGRPYSAFYMGLVDRNYSRRGESDENGTEFTQSIDRDRGQHVAREIDRVVEGDRGCEDSDGGRALGQSVIEFLTEQ